MKEIKTHQELEVSNILSFRGKVKPYELDNIMKDMEQKIADAGAKRVGNPITATYAMDKDCVEIEVLLPINQKIGSVENYKFKERVRITNAVLLSYKGNPAGLQAACNELNQYMAEHQLQPITVGYNITKYVNPNKVEDTEIDVYVGINPNIL